MKEYEESEPEVKVRKQIEFMEKEFEFFKKAYPTMTFVECKPSIDKETGKLNFPTHSDYIKTYTNVVQTSFMRRYFGCYYSGMTELGTGNWVTLPDSYKIEANNALCQPSDEVAFISQNVLGKIACEVGYCGYVWFSLDCPQGGNWVLQMFKEYKLYR